jgi:ABC-type multidrug transport system ATPase subunit
MPSEERSGFYGRLTGWQNLKFFGALHGLSTKDMNRIIGNLALQIGLKEELDRSLLKLSSGEKQKIALARALLHNPPLLILDEPVRNLDPHTVLRIRRLLKDLLTRNQGKTIILSTHLLEEAQRVADVILILRQGQVLKCLPASDLEKELKGTSLEEFYLKTVDAEEPA